MNPPRAHTFTLAELRAIGQHELADSLETLATAEDGFVQESPPTMLDRATANVRATIERALEIASLTIRGTEWPSTDLLLAIADRIDQEYDRLCEQDAGYQGQD